MNALERTKVEKSIQVVIFEPQRKMKYASDLALSVRYKSNLLEMIYVFREDPRPHLVLVDVDGDTGACTRMMENVRKNQIPTCPIVLLSNKQSDEDLAVFARVVKADGILPQKQVSPTNFQDWVKRFLEEHGEKT